MRSIKPSCACFSDGLSFLRSRLAFASLALPPPPVENPDLAPAAGWGRCFDPTMGDPYKIERGAANSWARTLRRACRWRHRLGHKVVWCKLLAGRCEPQPNPHAVAYFVQDPREHLDHRGPVVDQSGA